MKFRTTLFLAGKTATGIVVPEEVVAALGSGKRPPVTVTINGHSYRSTIAVMSGDYMLPVSAEHRTGAGIEAGQEIEVDVELDAAPRLVVVPPDFAEALDRQPEVRRKYESLSYSHKKEHVLVIEGAKTAETRQRRIDKAVAALQL